MNAKQAGIITPSGNITLVDTQDPQLAKALGNLVNGMSEEDLRRLLYVMCVFELKRGDVLVKEGDHTESLFIVQHGALRVTVGKGARQIELPEVTTGQWVGEVSLLDPGPASATVKVLRKTTTVLEFSHTALKEYLRSNPVGAGVVLEALARNLAERLHRTSDGLIRSDDGHLSQQDAPPAEPHGWFKEMLLTLAHRDT